VVAALSVDYMLSHLNADLQWMGDLGNQIHNLAKEQEV
jgi:hypothetical protein